jgi:hypothetical protein
MGVKGTGNTFMPAIQQERRRKRKKEKNKN